MTEHTLRVLLVEDDTTSCMEINDYISRLDDVTLVASTNNASTAIEHMKESFLKMEKCSSDVQVKHWPPLPLSIEIY